MNQFSAQPGERTSQLPEVDRPVVAARFNVVKHAVDAVLNLEARMGETPKPRVEALQPYSPEVAAVIEARQRFTEQQQELQQRDIDVAAAQQGVRDAFTA